jgi:hypothetical protein
VKVGGGQAEVTAEGLNPWADLQASQRLSKQLNLAIAVVGCSVHTSVHACRAQHPKHASATRSRDSVRLHGENVPAWTPQPAQESLQPLQTVIPANTCSKAEVQP